MRFTCCVLFVGSFARAVYGGFAVDLPIVTHTQGVSTTFYTSLDVTNHTSDSTDVTFEYLANDLSVDAVGTLATLSPHGNFHSDDILPYLASKGFITSAQGNNGFGTLL